MKTVEVLLFDSCPNADVATSHAREAIARAGLAADLSVVRIDGPDDAIRLRFLGSPTIRVDGVDVDGAADTRTDFGMQCRVYSVDGRLRGAPPIAWIEAALRGVTRGSSGARASSDCCSADAPKRIPRSR